MWASRSSRGLMVGAGIVAALGLSPFASAQAAGPPTPSVSVQYELVDTCDVKVTYTWSGLKGGHLTALVGISVAEDYGMWEFIAPVKGKSGTASATIALEYTGETKPMGYGFARLDKPSGTYVDGSVGFTTEPIIVPCRIPVP